MVFGTPAEAYQPEVGSKVLYDVGQEKVGEATKHLLETGVLAKLVKDPTKQKPGRQLKISEP
jgi:oxalate---CoA ligase